MSVGNAAFESVLVAELNGCRKLPNRAVDVNEQQQIFSERIYIIKANNLL